MNSQDESPRYKVGYKRPPPEHRFKKGLSGNPAGRKPKAENRIGAHPVDGSLQKAWFDEANKEVTVTINGRRVRRTMGHLAIERLFADAAAGKLAAQRIVQAKLTEVERIDRERWFEGLDVSAKLWREARCKLQSQLDAGVIDPVVIPHPDDFIFNKVTQQLEMVGPMDEEQHTVAMLIVRCCERLVDFFDSGEFSEPAVPRRLELIQHLSDLNAQLPPRLKVWPKPRFPEDVDLFPLDFVKKWSIAHR